MAVGSPLKDEENITDTKGFEPKSGRDGTAAVAARISVATSTVHSPPSTATSASVARIRTTVHPNHLPL